MNRRQFVEVLGAVATAALMATLWIGVGAAEETPIRIQRRVEWIAAQVMVISLDGMVIALGGPAALEVDLSQVDQDEYQGLVTGDPVLVTGTVPRARNRIIATSVQRFTP